MRKWLLIFSLGWLFSGNCYAQLGIIEDSDGYTNVRIEGNSKGEIISKIYDYELFWIDSEYKSDNSWKYIWFFEPLDRILKKYPSLNIENAPLIDNRIEEQGFMHESRMKNLHDYSVRINAEIQNNTLKCWNKSFSIFIKKVPFKESVHTIGRDEQGFVCTIDSKSPFGIDGFLPKYEIEDISLKIGSNEIAIPKECYSDLYEPNFKTLEVSKKNNVWFISMWNSDGAGGYIIVWIIRDGNYWQRYVIIPF